jgi:D-alanyl-D-alanine endopeptidase (penicillin-binding protein 7)
MRNKLPVAVLVTSIVLLLASGGQSEPGSHHARALRLWEQLDTNDLQLRSKAALVVDRFGNTLFERAADQPMAIASITKLVTAIVVLDAGLPMQERIEITRQDRDLVKKTGSRLAFGARLTRAELLTLALMASENRAAAALARTYPGGTAAFVAAMNRKATALGMRHSHFVDPAGLDPRNVASAHDLSRLVVEAMRYPAIRAATTRKKLEVRPWTKRGPLRYVNTNRLLRNGAWDIQVSKTGYIREAGRCLVMYTDLAGTSTVMVFLNSYGKLTPFGDANRVRKWVERGVETQLSLRDPAGGPPGGQQAG